MKDTDNVVDANVDVNAGNVDAGNVDAGIIKNSVVGAGNKPTKSFGEEICKSLNNMIIFVIFCIVIIILIVSLYILAINIINYILFTIYCISDNIADYTAEDPENIILGNKYKYRLINYVNNLNYNACDIYISNNSYDTLSSDLYIHKTITYYNYIVKLLLVIIMVILICTIYNIFNIVIIYITECKPLISCNFIHTDLYNNNTHIYYIIIIISIYICVHSYIYTYGFNKNIYKDIFDLYDRSGSSGSNYKSADMMVYNAVNYIKDKDTPPPTKTLSQYLDSLKDFSYDNIYFDIFLNADDILSNDAREVLSDLINNGIIANNKFIIPTILENEDNTNILLKQICMSEITADAKAQELLANKIYLYLIYHYVIAYNNEDPLIIHKLNNIFLDTFKNLCKKYDKEKEINNDRKSKAAEHDKRERDKQNADSNYVIKLYDSTAVDTSATSATTTSATPATTTSATTTSKTEGKGERNDILDKFNSEIKYMYNEIKGSYTIKLLLPANTTKQILLKRLENNADLILKYIYTYKKNEDKANTEIYKNLQEYKVVSVNTAPAINIDTLKTKLRDKISDFTDTFSDFYQENKTLIYLNTIVYKINFYLAIEMLITIIFILIVLLILYKSNKYPFLEKYINIAITYAILIINEVISAILGIV